MIDLQTEFGQHADHRLREEDVIWLTTITPAGVAQPNPVWFYWDGELVTIYSQPSAHRIRNLQDNRMVSLNLEGADVMGNNVVVITGEASLRFNNQQIHPAYKTKYARYFPEIDLSPEQLIAEYSVEITVQPTRLRGSL